MPIHDKQVRCLMGPRRRVRLRAAGLVVAAIALTVAAPATAQHGMPPGQELTPEIVPDSALWPRGQRDLKEVKLSAWRKVCFATDDAKPLCRTTISVTSDTGQEVLRVDLIEGDGSARLQLLVPPRLYLPAGIKVSVDGTATTTIPFNWCFTNVCVAASAVDAGILNTMEAGRELTLQAVDASLLAVNLSVPLDQFAAVKGGAPTQSYDRSLESK